MTWNEANDWIISLNSNNYLGYDDWRLPSAVNPDGTGPDYGYNPNTKSEMGCLFYEEIGSSIYSASNPLNNIETTFVAGSGYTGRYWYGESYGGAAAWQFGWNDGIQDHQPMDSWGYLWPVRSVNSSPLPIPEPSTLLITGLTVFIASRYRKKFN